jgi:mono/diheme cytochrome c family protein
MPPRNRLLRTVLALAAAAVLAFLLTPDASHGGEPAAAPPPEIPPAPEGFALDGDLERGRELFVKHCAVCHGERGEADGKLSPHLKPPPGNLPERVGERSDWELYLVVRDGGQAVGRSPVMVGFGERLDEQALVDVATFARSLQKSE